jgi:hypothetical protein
MEEILHERTIVSGTVTGDDAASPGGGVEKNGKMDAIRLLALLPRTTPLSAMKVAKRPRVLLKMLPLKVMNHVKSVEVEAIEILVTVKCRTGNSCNGAVNVKGMPREMSEQNGIAYVEMRLETVVVEYQGATWMYRIVISAAS